MVCPVAGAKRFAIFRVEVNPQVRKDEMCANAEQIRFLVNLVKFEPEDRRYR